MYIVTGNDDVFALNAKTGEFLWERWSGIDQKLTSVCCGWDNRGVAMGEGMVFLGQLDANVVALDIKTGKEVWKTPIEVWQDGYGITSAPLYYDGIVYSGITGGEYGVRGRLTALDAKTGKILWRWYTTAAPGQVGGDSWPAGTDAYLHGGASIWNTPAVDPQLGLIYFATGNCGPDYDGVDARRRQSLLLFRCRAERQDRRIRLAFPGGAPRHLGLRRGEPGRSLRHRHQRPAAQGNCPGRTHRLGLHSRPHERQAAGRHRGDARCRRNRGKRPRKRSPIRSATRPYRNAPNRWRDTKGPVASSNPSGTSRHWSSHRVSAARTGRPCRTIRIPGCFTFPAPSAPAPLCATGTSTRKDCNTTEARRRRRSARR